jgi:hypothetical protein
MATPGTLSPDLIRAFSAMGIPAQQQQQPNLSNYAQQPMQQATPVQVMPQEQALRTSPDRQAYFQAVEQRFQELANQVGGINNLVKYNAVEYARNRALKDIQQIYGEPPAIERPPQLMNVQGVDYAVINGKPVEIPSATKRQAEEIALKKAQADLMAAEKEARSKDFDKVAAFQKTLKNSEIAIKSIDDLLNDPNLPAGVGLNAIKKLIPATKALDISTKIDQIAGQNFIEAYDSLRGAQGITDIEGRKAEQSRSRVRQTLSEQDFRQALLELRDLYTGFRKISEEGVQFYNPQKAQSLPQIPAAPTAPAEPMKVPSPGAVKVVRDPTTGRLIRQQ